MRALRARRSGSVSKLHWNADQQIRGDTEPLPVIPSKLFLARDVWRQATEMVMSKCCWYSNHQFSFKRVRYTLFIAMTVKDPRLIPIPGFSLDDIWLKRGCVSAIKTLTCQGLIKWRPYLQKKTVNFQDIWKVPIIQPQKYQTPLVAIPGKKFLD